MSGLTRDAVLTLGLVLAFGAFVTVHVATIFGLARRHHVPAALSALVVPPLAPYWALTRGMPVRAVVWMVSAGLYVVAFVLAR
jgi:hypothetical protein